MSSLLHSGVHQVTHTHAASTQTLSLRKMKSFTSPTDGCQFDYYIENGTLNFKIDGLDWQDFDPADRRSYDDYQYNELLSLLNQ
tara:strand:+ start:26 stop:277 length:252 start_codon:yes stop_codon:yes gene_type:complete